MEEEKIVDIDTKEAVLFLPTETYRVEIIASMVDENGESYKVTTILNPSEVRKAFDLFDQTCDGEYPQYQITEEGKKWLEETLNGN